MKFLKVFSLFAIKSDLDALLLAVERSLLGRKDSTKNKCRYLIKHWIDLYGGLLNPSRDQVMHYLEHARKELNLSNKTIKATFQFLQKVYKEFESAAAFDEGISLLKINPKIREKRFAEVIPFNKVIELIETPDKEIKTGLRDRAFLALMLGGALRISEALNLRLSDIKLTQAGVMFVFLRSTKKGRPDKQPIAPFAYSYVNEYLACRKKEGARADDIYLTAYSREGRYEPINSVLDRRWMSRRFKTYCELNGIKNVSPHSCRATAITKLLADGVNHREVQEFGRHESVEMVELYDRRRFEIDDSPALKLGFAKKNT